MKVFVLDKEKKPLMPCSNRKARILLKEKKAKIFDKRPFTIQLLHNTSKYKKEIVLGVDTGYKHLGIATNSGENVLIKGTINHRNDIKD